MIWTRKAKLHWAYCEIEGLEPEVRVIDGVSHWALIDLETGEILQSAYEHGALDAMHSVTRYLNAEIDKRRAIEGVY